MHSFSGSVVKWHVQIKNEPPFKHLKKNTAGQLTCFIVADNNWATTQELGSKPYDTFLGQSFLIERSAFSSISYARTNNI